MHNYYCEKHQSLWAYSFLDLFSSSPPGGGAEAATLKKGVERMRLRICAARRQRSKRLRATLIKRSLIFSAQLNLHFSCTHTATRRREESEFQRGVSAAASLHATAFNLGANNNNFAPNNESQSSLERS